MVGLATAFPVAIGIALVAGTILSYILQPKGNVKMIAGGFALCRPLPWCSTAKSVRPTQRQ